MDRIGDILKRATATAGLTFSRLPEMTDEQIARHRAMQYNSQKGTLNYEDGYECPKCLNRGDIMVVTPDNGCWREQLAECECMTARRGIMRLKRSGLYGAAQRCTFDSYTRTEEWQKRVWDTAKQFVDDDRPNRWFFIGGAVGCGKTHICTAITCELMAKYSALYIMWQDESAKIKAVATDAAEYAKRTDRIKNAGIVYLDDLFKITGDRERPTAADIRLAHEILNNRYATGRPTIISSERLLDEIAQIDQAIGGRIAERARGYTLNIAREAGRDYRIRLAGTRI